MCDLLTFVNNILNWIVQREEFEYQKDLFSKIGLSQQIGATQQIDASVCSGNLRVHDVLIWNYLKITMCSITK